MIFFYKFCNILAKSFIQEFCINMLKSINSFEKCYPKRLKKIFQSDINYKFYNKIPLQTRRYTVGSVPQDIIQLVNSENKAVNIIRIQNAFGDVASYLRKYFWNLNKSIEFNLKYLPPQNLRHLEERTSLLLTQKIQKSFDKEVNATIKFVDRGDFANVFKLSLNDKDGNKLIHDKAIKVYHYLKETSGLSSNHGSAAEANFWTWIKHIAGHKLDKTQFNKHYISDLNNGYAMTEFLDEDIISPSKNLNIGNLLNIYSWDLLPNRPIRGKIYDIGGFAHDSDFIKDKMVMRYYKKLYYRHFGKDLPKVMDNLEKEAKNPKNEHRTKIQKALDVFKAKFKTKLEERFKDAGQN